MNIQSAVIEGTSVLKSKSILSAQLDTEILMAKALNKNREYIILNHDKVINNENLEYFKKLVHERATRKPIAYLLNKKFFWKSEFYVDKNTLIPRPDTEIIIEQILKVTKNKNYLSYSRSCPWQHKRQPVIVDDDELKKIESADKKSKSKSFDGLIKYRGYNYICPRYWCFKDDNNNSRSISFQQINDGECGGWDAVIPEDAKKVPKGKRIFESQLNWALARACMGLDPPA